MKVKILAFCFFITIKMFGQQASDSAFFPDYTPYSAAPIIKYGDGFYGAAWNDPCVLKEGSQYIMYASAEYGLLHIADKVRIYRLLSNDGYSWLMSQPTPVLEPAAGTYYEGGTETPSVVFYKGNYHLYTTSYPQNVGTDFVIAHAVSADGINFVMDSSPLLESDGGNHWMGSVVAEPGVMVKNDTLYIFFTAIGLNGSISRQSIGLLRTVDGTTILDTNQVVLMPEDVYPSSQSWYGLSTPSATMVGDTIYLFTDVATTAGGSWQQTALHQFKCYGNIHKWYHDVAPLHTRADFYWTNGTYYSELSSIAPLYDGNRLRIYYAGHKLANIVGADTTYNLYFEGNEMHVDTIHNYWGIGTSEYVFNSGTPTQVSAAAKSSDNVTIFFDGQKGGIEMIDAQNGMLSIYTMNGSIIMDKYFLKETDFVLNKPGIYIIKVVTDKSIYTHKISAY